MTDPRRFGLALAAVTLAVVSACSTSHVPAPPHAPVGPAPAPDPPPDPEVSQVNSADPDAVSRAAVDCYYRLDTIRDDGYADGLRHALPLLSPSYAAAVRTSPTPAPDADWTEWSQHHAHTDVALEPSPEDHPPDSSRTAYRAWIVTATPTGTDGWLGPPHQALALVTLSATPQGWRVGQIDPH